MTTPPAPPMPLPRRASPSRVTRYLVASLAHATRLFPPGGPLHTFAVAALEREGGAAVIVESLGGTTAATMPLANGHEVADALAGVTGAVTFMVRNQPATAPVEPMADCAPVSCDPALASVEVEVVRLREQVATLTRDLATRTSERDYLKRREQDIINACERVADGGQYRADIVSAIETIRRDRDHGRKVETAARALLACMPQCGWCSKRVATCAKRGVECCDRCAEIGEWMAFSGHTAEQVRALEAALGEVA